MIALSSRPFCPCDGRQVSLSYLAAGLRYTTESDGTSTKPYQEFLSAILSNFNLPYAIIAGALLDLLTEFKLYLTNTDDYLGSYAEMWGRDFNDHHWWDFRPIDRIQNVQKTSGGWKFELTGDGSLYGLEIGRPSWG